MCKREKERCVLVLQILTLMELRTKHEAHISTDQTMHNIIMKLKSTELNRNLETKEMASL